MPRIALFIVVAVGVILAAVLLLRPEGQTAIEPTGEVLREVSPTPEPDPFAAAQVEYADATKRLRGALEEQASDSDAELMDPVEENLGFLEQAVVEVMLALAENPESDSLHQRLLDVYEVQVQLLQKALRLTGDE